MTWKCEITEFAYKDIKKLDFSVQKKIIDKVYFYVLSQKPLDFASKIVGCLGNRYRFRIGDYRVIFEITDSNIVRVLAVGHRREVYK